MKTQLLKRHHEDKEKMSVGRGGKRGKTSGRGTKGQKARSGHKIRPEIRDMLKRLPKLRGRGKNSAKTIQMRSLTVNVGQLDAAFNAGDVVDRAAMIAKKLVRNRASEDAQIKVLSDGEITKKLTLSGVMFSAGAKAKIEKAGGSIAAK